MSFSYLCKMIALKVSPLGCNMNCGIYLLEGQNIMKKFLVIIAIVSAAVLSLSSCSIDINIGDNLNTDAYLTAYYAGGLPDATSQGHYGFSSTYLSDRDVEDIFYDLSQVLRPGFTDAVLEVEFYNRRGEFRSVRVYDFWWEPENGWYAWEER